MSDFSESTWIGTWEDGTGYWIEIRMSPEGLKITRSGFETKNLQILSLSHKNKILRYKETRPGISYQHTLILKDAETLSDEWKIVSSGIIWKRSILKKSTANQAVDTTAVSAPR